MKPTMNEGKAQAGKVTPVIDRRHTPSEVPDAVRYSESGRARGKIVINVQPGPQSDEV